MPKLCLFDFCYNRQTACDDSLPCCTVTVKGESLMPDVDAVRRVSKLTNSPREICPNNRGGSRDFLTENAVCGNDVSSCASNKSVFSGADCRGCVGGVDLAFRLLLVCDEDGGRKCCDGIGMLRIRVSICCETICCMEC